MQPQQQHQTAKEQLFSSLGKLLEDQTPAVVASAVLALDALSDEACEGLLKQDKGARRVAVLGMASAAGAGGSSSSSVVPVGSATFKDEMAAMRRQLTEQEQFFKEEMAKMQERQERAMQDWQRDMSSPWLGMWRRLKAD